MKDCKRHLAQVVMYPKPAVEGMARIGDDGEGDDEYYNEYDDILDQIELAEMRVNDQNQRFQEISVNLNDGDMNRPYTFNPMQEYDIKKDKSEVCF